MCKNNLGCEGKQNCGCPTCGKGQSKKTTAMPIPSASFAPSGYSKKQQTAVPLPKGSGYSKKTDLLVVREETPAPKTEAIRTNEKDNFGIVVSSIGLGVMLFAVALRHPKNL